MEFLTSWPVAYARYGLLRRPPHGHLRVRAGVRDDAYEVEVPPPAAASEGDRAELELGP